MPLVGSWAKYEVLYPRAMAHGHAHATWPMSMGHGAFAVRGVRDIVLRCGFARIDFVYRAVLRYYRRSSTALKSRQVTQR